MTIEKLHVIPAHEKVEDGYAYNEKYIGNVYQHKDMLVYFREKSTLEFPIKVFETYKNLILDELSETTSNLESEINTMESQYSDISQILDRLNSRLTNIEVIVKGLNSEPKEELNKEDIGNIINIIIDKKLTEVYNNFNSVTHKLVTEAITEALKDSKRDQSGKLKMSTLMMAKEMGLTPDEIIKYSENGLL